MSKQLVFTSSVNLPVPTITEEGPMMVINNEEIPVFDAILEVSPVQPGHVKKDKSLAKHIAEFNHIDLKEFSEKLRLLPIAEGRRGRQLFSEYDDGNNELLCYSVDGIKPSPKVESPMCEVCANVVEGKNGVPYYEPVCEQASWENGKPECGDYLWVIFFDMDLKIPIKIRFKGIMLSAWNKFKRDYNKYKNIARLKRQSIYDYIIEATLENEGNYCSLNLELVESKENAPKEYVPLMAWYLENLVKTDMAKAEESEKENSQESDGELERADVPVEDSTDPSNEGDSEGFEI